MKNFSVLKLITASLLGAGALWGAPAQSIPRGDLHMAVYAEGFVVDTQRQATYGDRARRVQIKTQAHGTAQGETPDSSIEIDRVDRGVQWSLNPHSKTYSEEPYRPSFGDDGRPASSASSSPPTLKVAKIDPTVSGPLGSALINGFRCQSYTIRIVADFLNPQTGKVVATETLLEKLWVTEKAPEIVRFRKAESDFHDAVSAVHGTEKANFRWLLREFNRTILESNGNPEDFIALQRTYQGARAGIKGVTVRQLAGWNWRPKEANAPGGGADMHTFIASIAAGLGAPPDETDKTPLTDAEKPKWAQELEKDLGRGGSSTMMLEEVLHAGPVSVPANFFEVPEDYRKI